MPRSRASRMIARTSFRPTGSSAEVGSSRITRSGRAEERDPQPETLLHPLREGSDDVLGAVGQADEAERRVDRSGPVRARQAGEVAVQRQHLPGPHPRLIAEQLGEVADPSPRRPVAERRAEDPAAAAARAGQAEQQLDDRRLARAVGAEQAEHLAALDGHRQAVEGAHASVLLGEVDRLDRGSIALPLRRGRSLAPRCGANGPLERDAAIAQADVGVVADHQVVEQVDVEQPARRRGPPP